MKKAIIIALCAVALTGCSIVENILNPPQDELVEKIDQLIQQERENDKILNEADVYNDNYQFKDNPTPTEANETLSLLSQAKPKVEQYKKAVDDIESQLPELETLASKITDDQLGQMADETMDKLTESVEKEKELISKIDEMNKLNEVFYGDWAKGIKPAPDNYGTIKKERQQLRDDLNSLYTEIDDVWFKFYEEVTGNSAGSDTGGEDNL